MGTKQVKATGRPNADQEFAQRSRPRVSEETLSRCLTPEEKRQFTNASRKDDENCTEKEIFHTVLESGLAGVAIGILRADGTLAWCNAGLSDKIGYTPEEVIGTPLLDLFWQTEVESAREKIESHFNGGADLIQFESAFRSRTGEKIEILVTGKRTIYEGKPASVGVVVD